MTPRRLLPAGVLTAALALAACSTDQVTPTPPNPVPPTASTPPRADAERAIRAAEASQPGGRAFDVETERGDWEIKVAAQGQEYKVAVKRDGSQVIGSTRAEKTSDDVAKVEAAGIDAAKALDLARQDQPGELDEMEIDSAPDGTPIWQVDLRDGAGTSHEIHLDANSGAVR